MQMMIVRMKSFFFYSDFFFLCVTFVVSFLRLFQAIASPGQALQRNSTVRQGRCCHCLRVSGKPWTNVTETVTTQMARVDGYAIGRDAGYDRLQMPN